MPRLILKCPYFKGSKSAAHLKHLVKYIATREGVEQLPDDRRQLPVTENQREQIHMIIRDFPDTASLFEYEDYLSGPTVGNASDFIGIAIEQNLHQIASKENYIQYIATRPRVYKVDSHGLFSGSNDPIILAHIAEDVSSHAGNIWTPIISLRRGDAERLGFNNAESWRDMIKSKLAELAESMKIHPDHLQWYAAFHNESHHPHIHMVCYSSDPHEGFLTRAGIEQMKSCLVREIYKYDLKNIYAEQSKRRNTLGLEAQEVMKQLVRQIKNRVMINESIERLVTHLADRLQYHTGKMQYGYLKAPLKAMVDEIVDELARDVRVAEAYRLWYQMRNEVLGSFRDELPEPLPLSQQKEFKSIRNMIITEATNLMNHTFTFEDEGMSDEPAYTSTIHANEVWKQVEMYRSAKRTLYDENASFEDRNAELLTLERLYAEDFSVAAHLLGKLYRDGVFVLRDEIAAEKWFRSSAEAGNDYSEYALGKLLFAQNRFKEAVGWLEKAAEQVNQHAQYRLGKIFLSGEGLSKDVLKALDYLFNAAHQGNQYAQYTLGKLYLIGTDVQQDRDAAKHWFNLSASQGNRFAQFFLDNLEHIHNPSAFLATTRLLTQMGRLLADNTPSDRNGGGIQPDRKLLRKIREKKTAQGHRKDDHLNTQSNNHSMTM